MNLRSTLLATLLSALPLAAQTQLLRGDVDAIQNTAGRFQLKCTNLELFSATVDLQALHDASRQQDIDYEMQVRPTVVNGRAGLEVVSAVVIAEALHMGNLRFGRNETWEIFATAGSQVWTFVSVPAVSSYQPLGAAGTWLIGNSQAFVSGFTDAAGRFQFRFTMPTLPALVGRDFNSQAVIQTAGVFWITSPDCKTVQN